MEKTGTPSNRLTRSSARNTPSRKTEESSDVNAAEELKNNLRKSRRKTDTNLKTNGDTATDMDPKKSRNYEEISDCNSLDSVESNISSKQKDSPKPKNHKTPSPTISRKSLRTRRSITPGPEAELNVTRKMTRSTSESKLDSVSTPTRRNMRAKSESKDFVFTPSKRYSNDTEQLHPEANSKSIPSNSALRVIDEIIEEDNELESVKSPKKSPPKLSNVEIINNDCILLNDTNNECNEHLKTDKNFLDSNIEGNVCQDEKTQLNSFTGSNVKNVCESKELTEKESNLAVGEDDNAQNQKSEKLTDILDTKMLVKTNDQLTSLDETEVNKDFMSKEVSSPKNVSELFVVSENAGTPNKSSDQLSVVEDVESAKETSFNLSISEEVEIKNMVNNESLDEANNAISSDDKQIIETQEEIDSREEYDEKNTSSFKDSSHSKNDEFCEIDKGSNVENLLKNNQTNISNKITDQAINKASSLIHSVCEDPGSMINDVSTRETPDFETPASGSENISLTENNNVSLVTEVQSENETMEVCHQDSIRTETVNYDSQSFSPQKNVISIDSEACKDDKTEDDGSVVICGSDSEEPCDDMDINNGFAENRSEADCEEETQTILNDLKKVNDNNSQKFDNQITDAQINENNSSITISIENIEEQDIIPDDNNTVVIVNTEDINESDDNKSINKDCTLILQSNGDTFDQTECTEVCIKPSEQLRRNSELERSSSEILVEQPRKLTEILDEEENEKILSNKFPIGELDENFAEDMNVDKETDNQFKESSEPKSFEDEVLSRDSASENELYKDMSDFGSDIDDKKDGSQYGDSASSTELKSGDSEEYASSFEGEEDEEETNNEENLISNVQETIQNIQEKIGTKVAEKLFDTSSPMTYDKALAILNKDRVKKIDDEEFFDMFTQELNKVSEESGSDSDIAIVDEYIAEPEEQQQQKKSNQKPGNQQVSAKNLQQSAPSNSVQNRSLASQQVPTQIKVNLKTSQKPDLSSSSVPQNFSGAYDQQIPTQHTHQGMNFPQGGLYHQYNPAMQVVDSNRGHVMYEQFAPPNVQDPRMFHPHHVSRENFPRGGMFSHAVGQVPDEQMHYSSGSLKIRSIDSICGAHQSNMMNFNSNSERPMSINPLSNPSDENNINMMMGVSTATMTETNDPLDHGTSFSSSSKKTNPILEILGLDKRRLNMLKKVLGLNESRAKQRNKIKQILIEEAQKMGINIKSTENIENRINREQRNWSAGLARKKQLVKKIVNSDSSFISKLLRSCSESSSGELDTQSQQTSSSRDESSGERPKESRVDDRKINLEDGSVSVTIDTRQRPNTKKRTKLRHRAPQKIKSITQTNERKRTYQSSESSDEENIRQIKKKKHSENPILIRSNSFEKKSQGRKVS